MRFLYYRLYNNVRGGKKKTLTSLAPAMVMLIFLGGFFSKNKNVALLEVNFIQALMGNEWAKKK